MKNVLIELSLLALLALASACGDDEPTSDAGTPGDGDGDGDGDAGDGDCFEDPQTHEEIINACTNAEHVDKDPELPLLLSDGRLPELP